MSSPIALSAPPSASIDAPLRRDTVLVVAGRARQRARFARRAAEQGHLVLEAADVPEALKQGQGARPDLVLVPGDAKGLRALAQLRANPELGSVAAIVLTRGSDLPTLLRAFDLVPTTSFRSPFIARAGMADARPPRAAGRAKRRTGARSSHRCPDPGDPGADDEGGVRTRSTNTPNGLLRLPGAGRATDH